MMLFVALDVNHPFVFCFFLSRRGVSGMKLIHVKLLLILTFAYAGLMDV